VAVAAIQKKGLMGLFCSVVKLSVVGIHNALNPRWHAYPVDTHKR